MSYGLTYFVDPSELQKQYFANTCQHYIDIFEPSGAGLPHFQGTYTQKGQGFLTNLFRDFALPLLHKAGPHLLHGVEGLIRDVRKGKKFKEAAKERGIKALKEAASSVIRGTGRSSVQQKLQKKKAIRKKKKKTIPPVRKQMRTKFNLFV